MGRVMERRSDLEKLCLCGLHMYTVCIRSTTVSLLVQATQTMVENHTAPYRRNSRRSVHFDNKPILDDLEAPQDYNTGYWLRFCYVFSTVSHRTVSLLLGTYEARGKLAPTMSYMSI